MAGEQTWEGATGVTQWHDANESSRAGHAGKRPIAALLGWCNTLRP